ncbi:MAG: LacI family DNA-binding transcriptional regulator [Burkholderiales bacterium]|nr:LacI family DNA-binding transcriptional regulator [Opitutaceae bacterium]
MPDVTLIEIARRVGVSKTAVSMALRGKPGLSEETKARILATARELGYSPNPISVELMALVRAKRRTTGAHTIAFINTFIDPGLFRRIEGLGEFVAGAMQRAKLYGYAVEVFEARAKGMTGRRLADILQARGIRGVLIGPRWGMEPELEFPWERFACVLVGEPEYGPNLNRVCNHHIHACATALRHLAAKGYRNIGVALAEVHEKKYAYDYLLGVDQFLRQSGSEVKVVPWLYDPWSDAEGEAWVEKHGFDALVSLSSEPLALFHRLRTWTGDRLGYASLAVNPGAVFSGISQHPEEIGAASVDLLRGLLVGGERGTVPRPRILLIEGDWVEGETTPGPKPKSAAARAPQVRRAPDAEP